MLKGEVAVLTGEEEVLKGEVAVLKDEVYVVAVGEGVGCNRRDCYSCALGAQSERGNNTKEYWN